MEAMKPFCLMKPFWILTDNEEGNALMVSNAGPHIEHPPHSPWREHTAAGTHRIAGPFVEGQARKVVSYVQTEDVSRNRKTWLAVCSDRSVFILDGGDEEEYWTQIHPGMPPIPQPSEPASDLVAELRALRDEMRTSAPTYFWERMNAILSRAGVV